VVGSGASGGRTGTSAHRAALRAARLRPNQPMPEPYPVRREPDHVASMSTGGIEWGLSHCLSLFGSVSRLRGGGDRTTGEEVTLTTTLATQLTSTAVDLHDTLTAFCALRRHAGEQDVFLLESLAGPSDDVRSSMIGLCGLLDVSVTAGAVAVTGDARLRELAEGALLAAGVARWTAGALRLTEPARVWQLPGAVQAALGLPVDAGSALVPGFLVVLGYDSVRYIERLPRLIADDGPAAPDVTFRLVHGLLEVPIGATRATVTCLQSPSWPDRTVDRVRAALAARPDPADRSTGRPPRPVRVEDEMTEAEFVARAERCLEHVAAGDVYQVQIGHAVRVESAVDEMLVYRRLRERNPSPYMAVVPVAGCTLVTASPELFVRADPDGTLTMRPVAGTAPRTGDADRDAEVCRALLADPKERAEHVMLVDLCRNDLSRAVADAALEVTDLMATETYSHLFHIVSTVVTRPRTGPVDPYEALRAAFPAGTMTGAPKIRAMEIIEELEVSRRGLYAGAFGLVGFGGTVATSLGIRMAVRRGTGWTLRASAGIVADSSPAAEWTETLAKLGAPYWAVTGEELS
jgi:anthranilate synthase component I